MSGRFTWQIRLRSAFAGLGPSEWPDIGQRSHNLYLSETLRVKDYPPKVGGEKIIFADKVASASELEVCVNRQGISEGMVLKINGVSCRDDGGAFVSLNRCISC